MRSKHITFLDFVGGCNFYIHCWGGFILGSQSELRKTCQAEPTEEGDLRAVEVTFMGIGSGFPNIPMENRIFVPGESTRNGHFFFCCMSVPEGKFMGIFQASSVVRDMGPWGPATTVVNHIIINRIHWNYVSKCKHGDIWGCFSSSIPGYGRIYDQYQED